MDKVAVLMSTFNGERFLEEQIDSILAQKGVEITLYIRDDGSQDRTIDIISKYLENHSDIIFVEGHNIGVGNSFMAILKQAGLDADYYAFADQDDIWLPEKLSAAITKLRTVNSACCYCSNQTLVDSEGNFIRTRHTEPINTVYMQVLCNNLVTGCTMVWNRKLQGFLIDPMRLPSEQVLKKRIHDVWVAMIASVAGEVIYDSQSFILYRQHNNNVVGVRKSNLLKEWKKKLAHQELRNGRSALAKEVLDKFEDIIHSDQIKEKLKVCACYQDSFENRLLLYRDSEIRECSNEAGLMYAGKVFLNLF